MAISTANGKDTEEFFNQLIDLQVSAVGGDKDQIMEKIRELVPAYNPAFVEPLESAQNGSYPGVVSPRALDIQGLTDLSASSGA